MSRPASGIGPKQKGMIERRPHDKRGHYLMSAQPQTARKMDINRLAKANAAGAEILGKVERQIRAQLCCPLSGRERCPSRFARMTHSQHAI